MQSLIENYEIVYQELKKFTNEIALCRERIGQINNSRDEEIPARITNLQEQLKKIDDYQLKIDGFMKLAEKHMTSTNVATIEAPPGYRVNLNRLRAWSMMIDPMSDDDPYAQRVYLVSKCDLYFLEQKKEEFNKKISELEADLQNGLTDEIKGLESKIEEINSQISNFLDGDVVRDFAKRVVESNDMCMYTEAPAKYGEHVKEKFDYWNIGAYGVSLDAGIKFRTKMKQIFGRFYDEESARVYLPIEKLPTSDEFVMAISCTPARNRLKEMDSGIRNIIFSSIDKRVYATQNVYIIDAVRQNSAIVGSLKQIEGTIALKPVPRNNDQIQSTLEEIVSSFSDIDDMLENHDTVAEYNKNQAEDATIARSLIVLVGWPDSFDSKCAGYINKIISGYERYGISLILVSISAKKQETEELPFSEYLGESVVHVTMSSSETTIGFGSEEKHRFAWYTFNSPLSEGYVKSILEHTHTRNILGTEYINRVDMEHFEPYQKGHKSILLPYGVDSRDQVHSLSFDNESFALYLMGASGSGKSTLLHTLITGIIRNYHPDDVELWLADFKMSEFAQYIDPMPPHVKYVLLDESPELVYDLLDRLTEKMMERQRFFMEHRDLKKVENVPRSRYMPVIFVILDEFSIMSQALAESEAYKLKLQNLLAKGRALGIKFIFSSQTFTKGIAGLTQTAKDQIQTRIAMKNSYTEINETLEISSSQRTEQVKNWMEALPPHYALLKYREGDGINIKRLQVMYFKGKGDEALAPQRKLINQLLSTMQAVSDVEYDGNNVNCYVDKQAVVVDGNSYKAFDESRLEKLIDSYKKQEKLDSDNGDLVTILGTPRRLEEAKMVTITSESRENIAILARNSEQACCMSIIMSIIKTCEFQDAKIRVWAYSKNKLYKTYYHSHFAGYEVCEGLDEICDSIRLIKNKIKENESSNEIIIMLGMEQICSDFEIIDFNGSKEPRSRKRLSVDSLKNQDFTAKTEEELLLTNHAVEINKAITEITDKMMLEGAAQGKSMKEIIEETQKVIEDYMRKDKVGVAAARKSTNGQKENSKEESEIIEEEVQAGAYKAIEDLRYIVSQGSRFGYHFLLCCNDISDIKRTKLQLELFRYKLAFQLSTDDSLNYFGNRKATNLPEHICYYSDSLEHYSFRPYIHEGVSWDGWMLDENGCATNAISN